MNKNNAFIAIDSEPSRSLAKKLAAHTIKPGEIIFVTLSELEAFNQWIAFEVKEDSDEIPR